MENVSNMSTAIYVKTESSDIYLYSYSRKMSTEDIITELKQRLGEEYSYISEIKVSIDGYDSEFDECKFFDSVVNPDF